MTIHRPKPILTLSALTIASILVSGTPAFARQMQSNQKLITPEHKTVSNSGTPESNGIVEKDGIYQVGGPVLPPKILKAPLPKYTRAAARAHFEGNCILSVVIDTNGRPKEIEIAKPVGFGLEKRAVAAVRKYRFQPATLNGKPVPVRIKVIAEFHICQRRADCHPGVHANYSPDANAK